jgi:hypothetical protein
MLLLFPTGAKMIRILETLQGELLLLKTAYRREGFGYVLFKGIIYAARWPINILTAFYYRHLKRNKLTFTYHGKTYSYFYHSYNTTWKNERSLEVPIIWGMVEENRDKRILEIGNVLKHYFSCQHDVVDLFEKYPGVINEDIIEFRPSQKYDLVVSISTFEHIGWDEKPRQPEKLLAAIQNLIINVIAPVGRLVITVPLGYNTELDKFLAEGKINFTHITCFRRFSPRTNEWEEAAWNEIRGKEFNSDGKWYGTDRILIIGVIQLGTSTS